MTTTIQSLLDSSSRQLLKVTRFKDVAWLEAELLLGHVLKMERASLLAHSDDKVGARSVTRFKALLNRRLKHEPLGYIFGETTFYRRTFLTDKRALIPRPETEMLVLRALEIMKGEKRPLVWDVGTGSGAIGVTIKKELPNAEVLATDKSDAALTLAKKNARRLKADLKFTQADLLSKSVEQTLLRFATQASKILVLANLPYLPMSDKRKLDPQVSTYEPSSALFTREQGLYLINRLLKQLAAFQTKRPNPMTILAEFDPPQARKLTAIARKYFPNATVKIHEDFACFDRFIEITIV